jgi:hypothetical protein
MSSLLGLVSVPTQSCSAGYAGVACKDCVRPGHYRLGDQCLPCPKTAYTAIAVFVVVVGEW